MAQYQKQICFSHKQYNSPLALYSSETVVETLAHQARVLYSGVLGTSFPMLAAAPHLAHSEVFKMVAEEERISTGEISLTGRRRVGTAHVIWPPNGDAIKQSPAFFTRCQNAVKRVAWPPNSPQNSFDMGLDANQNQGNAAVYTPQKAPPPVPPKPGRSPQGLLGSGNSSDTGVPASDMSKVPPPFASTELIGEREQQRPILGGVVSHSVPLRDEAPFTQQPHAIVPSQPVFKKTPVRMLGDQVWPPKRPGAQAQQQEESNRNETQLKPKRPQKDYRGFFGQHQIPDGFPTYRAPPGTQHFGVEYVTIMEGTDM